MLALRVTSVLTHSLAPSAIGFGVLFLGLTADATLSARRKLCLGADRPRSHHPRELTQTAWAVLIGRMGVIFLSLGPVPRIGALSYWIVAV